MFQLGQGGYRRPLSMGNQCTETHDRFRAEPPIPREDYEFEPNPLVPQGFLLHDHHINGPSKVCLNTLEVSSCDLAALNVIILKTKLILDTVNFCG